MTAISLDKIWHITRHASSWIWMQKQMDFQIEIKMITGLVDYILLSSEDKYYTKNSNRQYDSYSVFIKTKFYKCMIDV